MSRCSQKCNELKEKIDNISGLDDDYIFEILSKIENQIDSINKYADEDDLNGTCFKNCNMIKADYMFEKLGYELEDERICPHSYKYIKIKNFDVKEIIIEKASKWIDICYFHIGTDGKMSPIICIEHYLSMQELQAINQKCKELGWIE